MYSSKPSVNQLIAQMHAHGIAHVVVCPGSRNAPIVNDLFELARTTSIKLFPVTDERCAAFVAIGLYLATQKPAAVCVTSGTALLNTLPAVAEAYYRHAPLLIVSADRPSQDINQLKGQTLPQNGALLPYAPTWQLPEEGGQHCEERLSEALAALSRNGGSPVHINVPLTEPFHIYNTEYIALPAVIKDKAQEVEAPIAPSLLQRIMEARQPTIVVGHMDFAPEDLLSQLVAGHKCLVISDSISSLQTLFKSQQAQLRQLPNASCHHSFSPDLFIHIGGALVEKRPLWLDGHENVPVIRIEESADLSPQAFGRLEAVVHCSTVAALRQLTNLPAKESVKALYAFCQNRSRDTSASFQLSQSAAVCRAFMDSLKTLSNHSHPIIHVGNSQVLRDMNQAAMNNPPCKLFCNRGVNGIDGSLSVAAGHSLATAQNVYCVLGDLSFFYDSNALWNERLQGNLRILLINNGGGRIFQNVKGVSSSRAYQHIAGHHHSTARGICESYSINYMAIKPQDAIDNPQLFKQFAAPTTQESRPLLIECFCE